MNWLLLLTIGALPQDTVRLPQCTLPPIAAPAKPNYSTLSNSSPAKPRPVAVKPVAGLHAHVCPRCGTSWQHGHDSFGNVAQHTCPRCGTVQWNKAPAIQFVPGNCPGGFCPVR